MVVGGAGAGESGVLLGGGRKEGEGGWGREPMIIRDHSIDKSRLSTLHTAESGQVATPLARYLLYSGNLFFSLEQAGGKRCCLSSSRGIGGATSWEVHFLHKALHMEKVYKCSVTA